MFLMLKSLSLYQDHHHHHHWPQEVQEQQRLAEALGRVHQLLPLLLQNLPGRLPSSEPPPARL